MFSYNPINISRKEIRLLRLYPPDADGNSDDGRITCTLSTVPVNDAQYEALSYTWGSHDNKSPISLDGQDYLITSNLYEALQALRPAIAPRTLWVDALCIDQSNLQERAHQVGLMGLVYHYATSVVIWLGPQWEGCDLAMDAIERLGGDCELHIDPQHKHSLKAEGKDLDSPELQFPVARFFNLPWWSRVWTAQEYVLAQRTVFQCGDRRLDGDLIDAFSRNVFDHTENCCSRIIISRRYDEFPLTMLDGARAVHEIINTRRGQKPSFLFTIFEFGTRDASNPRDRIYGLLGLAPDRGTNLLAADYSLTRQQMCLAFVQAWIDREGNLDFLTHLTNDRSFEFPSFVPDWTVSLVNCGDHWDFWFRMLLSYHFDASKHSQCDFKFGASGEAQSTGIIVDRIDRVTEKTKWSAYALFVREAMELAGIGQDQSTQSVVYNPTAQSLHDAFWLTMTVGLQYLEHNPNQTSILVRNTVDRRIMQWRDWLLRFDLKSDMVPIGSTLYIDEINSAHRFFRAAVTNRKFFVTERGYFGFGPEGCRSGDIVTVLLGGKVPYVFRPRQEEGLVHEQYSVIGDAYVHGIMYGELFQAQGSPQFTQLYLI